MMKNLRTLKAFPVQASQTQPPWQEEYHQWTRMVWMRKERGLDEQESHVNILAWCVALMAFSLCGCLGPQPQQTPEHHLNTMNIQT